MPFADVYRRQVALLLRAIPLVAMETCFALKGGTAINLFVRDMPRLSVDIDLAYLPISDRTDSLADIDAALGRIADEIGGSMPRALVDRVRIPREKYVNKLILRRDDAQIKIEVTPVLRGCVYEPALRAVSASVEDQFGFAEIQVVSFADLFAGKIVAALDRQHPRDFFDARDLLANEGIDNELRKAFIIYLLSHNRPIAEVLAPTHVDIAAEFAAGFAGMTAEPVSIDALLEARESLIGAIVGEMPNDHRRFLMSVKRGEPDWPLLGLPQARVLPAVRWRLENLAKLDQQKREKLLKSLEKVLGLGVQE